MADTVAGIGKIQIGFIFHIAKLVGIQELHDLRMRAFDQRTDDRAAFQFSDFLHTRQSLHAGPACEIQKDRLYIIIHMMRNCDHAADCLRCFRKCLVPHDASGLFHTQTGFFCKRRNIRSGDDALDLQIVTDLFDKGFILIRFCAADFVIKVDSTDRKAHPFTVLVHEK